MPDVAPYGAWTSPLSAAGVAAAAIRLSGVALDGDDIFWLEARPAEGGRVALVRRAADGGIEDLLPRDFSVRTRVHEYGGGACAVSGGVIAFVNFADQRVYMLRVPPAGGTGEPEAPQPVTAAGAYRYADLVIDGERGQLLAVREDHSGGGEAVNTLVRIRLDEAPGHGEVLVSGHDFYSTPRLSPDGSRVSWLAWRHPQMPWDGTELWVGDVDAAGAIANPQHVAGSERESIYQPGWSPAGELYFVSDADGWWKLYRLRAETVTLVVRNAPPNAEFGRPQWVFGSATWAFAGPDRIVLAYTQHGTWRLATVHAHTGFFSPVEDGRAPTEWLAADARQAVIVAGAPGLHDAVVRLDLASGAVAVLRSAATPEPDPGYVSRAEAFEFPASDGGIAFGFYYAPHNADYVGPRGDKPPLLVIGHGGPTGAAKTTFDPAIQFWTSRGFAVADVNYGGSTGYGRAYRERLNGQWGVVDVADLVDAARHLVTQGKADVRRLIIRGASAGGYTTLAALTFYPGVFTAGASYFGISDLEALEQDTHKFESKYNHSLIGPYPELRDVYRARSPIHFVDKIVCALILFQGLEDKVVPPSQSEMMANALLRKGRTVEYHAYEGEQHGFRKAETIVHALEAELAFYGRVFGVRP
jgi:dipeptidyl aminopeptidase/acylaminoacyl peptidase